MNCDYKKWSRLRKQWYCTNRSVCCVHAARVHVYAVYKVYTYKRVVCVYLLVCWFVCFLSAKRHLSTLRRCLRVAERAGASSRAARRAAPRARAQACTYSERTRAHAVQILNEKIAALMPFKNKTVCSRMLSYT